MKVGDIVTVYQYPISEEHSEGDAVVVEILNREYETWNGRALVQARVQFVEDNDGATYQRFILDIG